MAGAQDDFCHSSASLFDDIQVRLFDSMHRLSQLWVSKKIETPQLVVVGAQNSGKSSVLEALIRFHFPVGGTKPTTRFPIKLILRNAKNETTQVRIEPGTSRSEEKRQRLHELARDLSGLSFDSIMERAKACLPMFPSDTPGESHGEPETFCDDVLVIERFGPSLPNLSLVDLPGLFDAVTPIQGDNGKEMVRLMVSNYIKSPMNIILLVVSAEVNDYANVPALGMLQDMQKEDATLKSRAVCIVTRPDTPGSLEATKDVLDRESHYSNYFAHPWHVVRNQDQEARMQHKSLDDRDETEHEFFSQSNWVDVPTRQKGIAALRETLKSMIWSHTQDQLPGVISEVRARIKESEAWLDSTVRARATPEARRVYLGDIAEKFTSLTREAVKGTYENEGCSQAHETGEACLDCKGFFAGFDDNSPESQQKRLRANVRALNKAFAAAMRRYGKTTVEVEAEMAATPTSQPLGLESQQQGDRGHNFQPLGTEKFYDHKTPDTLGRKEYERFVRTNIDRWKAKGPGGEPSDGAYSGLLAYQAKKWDNIASQHVKAIWKVVEEFIRLALAASCADKDILESLWERLVDPNLKKLRLDADRTLRDLISCHSRPNPGFYDSFIEASTVREHIKALLQRLAAMRPESREDPKGDPKSKDRNQEDREALVTSTLDNTIGVLGISFPLLNNVVVRKMVIPAVVRNISMAFDFNGGEEATSTEGTIQKTHQDLYPSDFEDLATARVIEQVEMHYDGLRDSFVGYVASLVVEQKIMGPLPNNILTMKLVRDEDEKEVEKIVQEKPGDAKARKDAEEGLKTMREVLQTMEEYIESGHRMAH